MIRTTTTHRAPPRYTHISIPGDEGRGVETAWYVYDRHNMRSTEKGEDMQDARDKARQLNRALQVGPNGR
jgi:hypothetical protein